MAGVREIRDRMRSIGDTQKITGAMYMIASNKMQKARKAHQQTEPYFYALQSMIMRLSRHMPPDTAHLYLETFSDIPEEERVQGYLVITDDKGLAGAYNHNVIRIAEEMLKKSHDTYRLYVVGEIGRAHFKKSGYRIEEAFRYTAQNPTLLRARQIAETILSDYEKGLLHEVHAIYTVAGDGSETIPTTRKLLPLDIAEQRESEIRQQIVFPESDFAMLPTPEALLANIVPDYLVGFIYGCLVEAYCAAQSARMTAMDNANRNADEMIRQLAMQYNRERQALITQEISEVAGGAAAMRKATEQEEQDFPV